jgi:pimeloyl-ACP methyl ester carboxylesterase
MPASHFRKPSWPRKLLRVSVALALLYTAFSLLVGVGFVFKQARRRPNPVRSQPQDLSPTTLEISFRTSDGYTIRGLLSPPPAKAPILFFQHGRGRSRDSYLIWARLFAQAGYGVVSFDWRGHGLSDGNIIHHSAREPLDLLAALQFLQERDDTRNHVIGLFGASMGAASLAMSADRLPPRVRCMVLDSPFGDLGRMADGRLARLGPLALGPRLVLDGIGLLLFGKAVHRIVPEVTLKTFAPRPILVIHGEHDPTIPDSEGKSLFAAYPGPKTFWGTPEPGHCKSRSLRTREWVGRLAVFFAAHLPGAPKVERVLAQTPTKLVKPTGWN